MVNPRNLNDIQLVGLTLWAEARNQPIEGIIAVGNVIRNRRRALHEGQHSYADVVLAHRQFSCWNDDPNDPNHAMLLRQLAIVAERTRAGLSVAPVGSPQSAQTIPEFEPALKEALYIASGLISGQIERDNTNGARWYMTRHQYETDAKWAYGIEPSARIGDHFFFTRTN